MEYERFVKGVRDAEKEENEGVSKIDLDMFFNQQIKKLNQS